MNRNKSQLPTGGSAAVSGFLYQLLSTGTRLLSAIISPDNSDRTGTVTAILEPRAGGDAIIEAKSRHCIQFKLRSHRLDAGALAGSVIPDLFGAHCDQRCDRYELQSNQALTVPAAALFSFLHDGGKETRKIKHNLDRATAFCKAIFRQKNGSEIGFEESFAAFRQKLYLAPLIDVTEVRDKLAQHLRSRIPYSDQVGARLDELTGKFLSRASQNDGIITEQMLAEMLDSPLRSDPSAVLQSSLQTALSARQYDVAFDVRSALEVSITTRLGLVAGASGNGKSWALCRLAEEAILTHKPALLLRASNRNELERELKRHIAVDALGHQSPIEPSALGELWRRRTGDPMAELLVIWEGCKNAEELKQIHYQGGLGQGLQLIAELPPDAETGGFLQMGITPYEITGFGESELFDALGRRGVNAGAVPMSIRQMLKHPVLCGLYAQLAVEDERWNPENEYRVLQGFWDRARDRAGKLAGTRLKALARAMVHSAAAEVTDSQIHDLGFNEAELGQLIVSGWLTQLSGKWRFAHERLLTWAIAEWMAEQFWKPDVTAVEIASQIETLENYSPPDRNSLHGLGFLTMDVLWLLATEVKSHSKVAELLVLLEDDPHRGASGSFYSELLPTIGNAIVDILLARIGLAGSDDSDIGIVRNVASAIQSLQLTQSRRDQLTRLLADGVGKRWEVLLTLASEWPLTKYRERIWNGLIEAYSALGNQQQPAFAAFERYRQAVLRLCRDDPAWLVEKLLCTNDGKSLGIGISLLREIDPEPHKDQWNRIAPHLFEHVPSGEYGQLIGFVRRVRDVGKIPFLIQQIELATTFAGDALTALSELDPQRALDVISARPTIPTPPRAGVWLHRLLERAPDTANKLIHDWLIHIDPTGCMLASFWGGAKAKVTSETLLALLQILGVELARNGASDRQTIRTLLELLGSAELDPAIDVTFHTMRGTNLAAKLRLLLKDHAAGAQNEFSVEMWNLLLRIGGEEFEAYVVDLLEGPVEWRAHGVNSAIYSLTCDVVAKLETMAFDWKTPYELPTRKKIWRILISHQSNLWYPRMIGLLHEVDEQPLTLGLELFDDLGFREDAAVLLEVVRLSKPGSELEARSINVAIRHGASHVSLLERALARFNKEGDSEGHLAACNVLLQERGGKARAQLDEFLLQMVGESSWNSTDVAVLAVRLRQADVSEKLMTAVEPFLRRRSFFGENIIKTYVSNGHKVARDILIERAFSPHSMFTNELPDMIDTLAGIDMEKAELAFAQAWVVTPKKQRYLVPCIRKLGIKSIEIILNHLPSQEKGQDAAITFRMMCVELRRRHEESLPLIRSRYAIADKSDRTSLVKVLSWMPQANVELTTIAECDPDPDIRDLAEIQLIEWYRDCAAVEAYRNDSGSIAKLVHALEIVDPEVLYWSKDEWSIAELTRLHGQHLLIAEDLFVRRFNKVAKTRYKHVGIRQRTRGLTQPSPCHPSA